MESCRIRDLYIIITLIFMLDEGWALKVSHHKFVDDKPSDQVKFAFAKHFQDHMVLQQAPARANIYGFSPDIGQKVTLHVTTSPTPLVYNTTVKPGPKAGVGVWSFTIDPQSGNKTVKITVYSGNVTLTLNDVLFGDVWICSGQSNMEFTVTQMEGAKDELADAHNYPNIRIMTVDNVESSTPLYDLSRILEPWTLPSNATLGGPIWQYFSAVCWLYGKAIHKALGYPIGLVASDWGGTPIEAWSPPRALAKCGVTSTSSQDSSPAISPSDNLPHKRLEGPRNNSILWNSMIHPLLGMTIKGAIWYQGESDASGEPMRRYNCTFPTMINEWRVNFHNASNGQTSAVFPFGFVQLAPYRPNPNTSTGFPDIRWHQTADHGYVPNEDMLNVFMAVTIDLPDFNATYGSVHPGDKKDTANRLALSGLAIAYGRNENFQGPFPHKEELTPNGLAILYDDRWTLEVRTTSGFELQCASGSKSSWVPTQITASNKTSITLKLTCNQGQQIKAVRYAWRESPCEFKKCAVYDAYSGLPAPPFIAKVASN